MFLILDKIIVNFNTHCSNNLTVSHVKNQTILRLSLLFLFIVNLSSCAPAGYTSSESGFFSGFIYGMVLFPFALLSKLFGMDYGLYAENNSGFFYWLGYIIGIGGLGSGGRAAYR